MTADLAVVPTHPETVAQRVRRLQIEAQTLARDHIQLLIQQIGEVEQTAHEIAQGGDAYPAGAPGRGLRRPRRRASGRHGEGGALSEEIGVTQRMIRDVQYLGQAEAHADEGPLGEPAARSILEMALRNTRAALKMIGKAAELSEPVAEWEALAEAFEAQARAECPVEPEATLAMIRHWTPQAEPANELGQVSFARAMLQSAERALDHVLARNVRYEQALRAFQTGAGAALATIPEDGIAADFLATIHRVAALALQSGAEPVNEAEKGPLDV